MSLTATATVSPPVTLTPYGGEKDALPLVVAPKGDRSVDALARWLAAERDDIQARMLRHGALLIRGFDVVDAPSFERVAAAIDPDLQSNYLGTSPRNSIHGRVFSASELPGHYPIPQHCEMTFLKKPPRRLFFGCLVAPAEGGETPLCDFRKVWADLDPAVRDRFVEGGVRIIRNYAGPSGGGKLDLWKLKRWDEMFLTTDKAEVERRCEAEGFEATWHAGDRLRLVHTQPAATVVPETGEGVWFSHLQVFHLSSAPSEYRRIWERTREPRILALWRFSQAMVAIKRRFTKTLDQSLHCTRIDGGELRPDDVEHLRDVIWKHLVVIPWQRGDVVAIDNRVAAHGRLPYRGPRQVVVSWA